MSPVTFRRFVVKAFDYEEWAIIVEARSREEAIDKARPFTSLTGLDRPTVSSLRARTSSGGLNRLYRRCADEPRPSQASLCRGAL
jgi:hypothetical protein